MNIKTSLTQLIGTTPLLELTGIEGEYGLKARLVAKLEYFNPLGSVKDRAAYAMILDAEERGQLSPGATIIEPTSGNTGVGLAFVCATRGYKLILTMPDTMSVERRMLLTALGAQVRLTPSNLGMEGSIQEAKKLHGEIPGSFMPMQFDNPANPRIHRETTAQEIWQDTDGNVDVVVSSFGSGGTVTGVAEGLKAKNPHVRIVGVEPSTSAVVSGGNPGSHRIQGIGAGFIPSVLKTELMDEVMAVSSEAAMARTAELGRLEGLLVGISSGATLEAGLELAERPENQGKLIVLIFPDTGERYLSSGVYGNPNSK